LDQVGKIFGGPDVQNPGVRNKPNDIFPDVYKGYAVDLLGQQFDQLDSGYFLLSQVTAA